MGHCTDERRNCCVVIREANCVIYWLFEQMLQIHRLYNPSLPHSQRNVHKQADSCEFLIAPQALSFHGKQQLARKIAYSKTRDPYKLFALSRHAHKASFRNLLKEAKHNPGSPESATGYLNKHQIFIQEIL